MCTTCGCQPSLFTPPKRNRPPKTTVIDLNTAILAENDAGANRLKRRFAQTSTLVLNMVSSPGSGKTALIVETIKALQGNWPIAVLEGDQQTRLDADRIAATGIPVQQINTGQGCHLDARMVSAALPELPLPKNGFLFIENVGNLVCPASFDLGEAAKVVILSVTEGEDKPLKYPDMFRAAMVMLVNKCDLLPHLDYRMEQAIAYAQQVNPDLMIFPVSARTGYGMIQWLDWLKTTHRSYPSHTKPHYRQISAKQ